MLQFFSISVQQQSRFLVIVGVISITYRGLYFAVGLAKLTSHTVSELHYYLNQETDELKPYQNLNSYRPLQKKKRQGPERIGRGGARRRESKQWVRRQCRRQDNGFHALLRNNAAVQSSFKICEFRLTPLDFSSLSVLVKYGEMDLVFSFLTNFTYYYLSDIL